MSNNEFLAQNPLVFHSTLLSEVREYIWTEVAHVKFTGLVEIIEQFNQDGWGPLPILPLASCTSVGGNPRDAVPVAAAWVILNQAIRLLDNLQDKDRPATITSSALTFHYVASLFAFCNYLLSQAKWSSGRFAKVQTSFNTFLLQVAYGQEQDIKQNTKTLADYWRVVVHKNGLLFAMICDMGALCGAATTTLRHSCQQFGQHLGNILQLFDDLEGVWFPDGGDDLAMNRVTLPVLYGVSREHPAREKLQQLVDERLLSKHSDEVRAILDTINTRDYIIWVALKEREQALLHLQHLTEPSGIQVLEAYLNIIFTDINELTVP